MRVVRSTVGGLALCLGLGCSARLPSEYPASDFKARDFEPTLKGDAGEKPLQVSLTTAGQTSEVPYAGSAVQAQVAGLVAANFPPPWTWRDGLPRGQSNAAALRRGQTLYQSNCVQCHGLAGAGDGAAAQWLDPKPRDYRRGRFKWKSTKLAAKPTRDDLRAVLRDGTLGASMPSFRLLPDEDLDALVEYVIYLSKRGEFERQIVMTHINGDSLADAALPAEKLKQVDSDWGAARSAVIEPAVARPEWSPETPEYRAAVERGKAIFLGEDAACYKCHGKDGKADPRQLAASEIEKMVDDWGYRNIPRNLSYGFYRGGRRPVDLYRRVHQGIAGTAMPGQGANPRLQPAQLWDLVYFIKEVPFRRDLLAPAKP